MYLFVGNCVILVLRPTPPSFINRQTVQKQHLKLHRKQQSKQAFRMMQRNSMVITIMFTIRMI